MSSIRRITLAAAAVAVWRQARRPGVLHPDGTCTCRRLAKRPCGHCTHDRCDGCGKCSGTGCACTCQRTQAVAT